MRALSVGTVLTCPANRLAVQVKNSGDLLIAFQEYEHSSAQVAMLHNDDLGDADQTSELTLSCLGE